MQNISTYLTVLVLFILFSCTNDDYNNSENKSAEYIENGEKENLPEVIKDIPVSIEVIHDPDTIYAKIHDADSTKFKWGHTTTVIARNSNIQIIEFGTYNLKDGKWTLGNLTKKPYKSKDFETWYFKKTSNDMVSWENCQGAYLIKDQEYIDPSNWSISNAELVERNGLWYYIGINDSGKKVCGYGRYITVPELSKDK